ncbi:uncharacterized protein LOC120941167 [Rana temporaria]|uniref:uncharacterized protein LOC120941167 n=1 Tax=Rana temporaria TaxID=8407 RepID=UPI001AAD86A0|nr:uncharacterized protein LOC120941167 [Rana temporaria]
MAKDVSQEHLIQLVHDRPALWDKRCAEYSDKHISSLKWEEIYETVTPEWLTLSTKRRRIRGEQITTRWRSLRDRFRRDLKEDLECRSGAGASKKKHGPFYEMLDFLRNVMDVRSTASNISVSEEEDVSDAEDENQEAAGDMPVAETQASPDANSATATQNTPRVPIRSVPASRGKRHTKKKQDMDAAMIAFMEDMRGIRRADSDRKDPFLDPTNEDANFLRSNLYYLQKIPDARKMEVHLAIGSFTGVCVRAALAGEPMPVFTSPLQRQYQPEQAPQAPHFQPHYHQAFIPQHHRAPATTAQNVLPPPQEPTHDSSTSQATSSQSYNPYPYSTSPRPFYQQLQ